MPMHYASGAGVLCKRSHRTVQHRCKSGSVGDLGWGLCLGIFRWKRDGYLIFSEVWLKLDSPFWVNLLLVL